MRNKHTLKRRIALPIAATILGTIHASTTKDPKISIAVVVKANNEFAIDLYQRECAEAGNLFHQRRRAPGVRGCE
jgi:hypothetical protein